MGEVRRQAIRRVATDRRVSLSVAAHIYASKSVEAKKRLTDAIERAGRTALKEASSHAD